MTGHQNPHDFFCAMVRSYKLTLAVNVTSFLFTLKLAVVSCIISQNPDYSIEVITFTESQNHRMVGIGRDLCGSSSPTLLPMQGHLQQAAQDLVQVGLEYLQRRRLHNLPGQPVPVLCHPQSESPPAMSQPGDDDTWRAPWPRWVLPCPPPWCHDLDGEQLAALPPRIAGLNCFASGLGAKGGPVPWAGKGLVRSFFSSDRTHLQGALPCNAGRIFFLSSNYGKPSQDSHRPNSACSYDQLPSYQSRDWSFRLLCLSLSELCMQYCRNQQVRHADLRICFWFYCAQNH